MQRAAAAALLALLLLSAPAGVRAQDPPKPHAVVSFEIQARTFRNNLPQRTAAEDELARLIAGELAQRYGFADWTTQQNAPAPGAPAGSIGSLVARLVESPAQPGPQIQVRWFGGFGAGAPPAALAIPPIEIYAPSNPNWHSNNKSDFVSHVSQKLLATIRADGFMRGELRREWLQRLPIASSVIARAEDRVIVIPRMWKHLRLGQQSVLAVTFSRGSGAQEERGQLKLVLPSQRPRDPGLGWVQAGVREASFGTRPLTLTSGWHSDLPTLLGGATATCFIDDYQPLEFEGTAGAVVLNPD